MDGSPTWCAAGTSGCGRGDTLHICITCVHEVYCCGAVGTLLETVERLLQDGHRLVDDSGVLLAEAARRSAREYMATSVGAMDPTGGHAWDCSRLCASLLADEASRTAIGMCGAPDAVLELGAGSGALAVALSGTPSFASAPLRLYLATDVAGRVPSIAAAAAGHKCVRAAALPWGEHVNTCPGHEGGPYALVICCELLYYMGECDALTPLAATLASACSAPGSPPDAGSAGAAGTTALVAWRERDAEAEARFFTLCRAEGLEESVGERVCEQLVEAFAPERTDAHGGAMRLRVLRRRVELA
mmetsp:Transcript_25286/g.51365  ORF Transcript_25286/g.51365 Transcript_25286/m.51365 type:complete len:302 (+) Transcript_25286:43-948(+)